MARLLGPCRTAAASRPCPGLSLQGSAALPAAASSALGDAGPRVVDELMVHVAPVLLGDGVRLFGHPGGTKVKFERISCTHAAKVTNLWLRAVT